MHICDVCFHIELLLFFKIKHRNFDTWGYIVSCVLCDVWQLARAGVQMSHILGAVEPQAMRDFPNEALEMWYRVSLFLTDGQEWIIHILIQIKSDIKKHKTTLHHRHLNYCTNRCLVLDVRCDVSGMVLHFYPEKHKIVSTVCWVDSRTLHLLLQVRHPKAWHVIEFVVICSPVKWFRMFLLDTLREWKNAEEADIYFGIHMNLHIFNKSWIFNFTICFCERKNSVLFFSVQKLTARRHLFCKRAEFYAVRTTKATGYT